LEVTTTVSTSLLLAVSLLATTAWPNAAETAAAEANPKLAGASACRPVLFIVIPSN
jgi:hypothetical protein